MDGFVLPRYDPGIFQARLVDVTEQITNELTTLKVHEHVTNTIKNLYPILSRFGMPIVGYDTDKNDQLTPFLDLPSGMGLYASQKEFFCLLGLERYAEELIDLTQETHPIIKDEPNSFWGIYSSTSLKGNSAIRNDEIAPTNGYTISASGTYGNLIVDDKFKTEFR